MPWQQRVLWAVVGCLIALALVALVLATLLFARVPRRATSAPTPTTATTPQIPTLSQQIAEIAAARAQGVPRTAWIAATGPDLTTWVTHEVAGEGVQVKQVTYEGNNVVIVGTYPLAGRTVDLSVTLLPSAENGRLNLEVQEGQIGRLPMPPGMKIAMQRKLEKAMNDAFRANPDVRVDSAGVRDNVLIITGAIGVH
jgi:uncharacterized protein YpmS